MSESLCDTGNAKGYVQGVCVSVVNGMNWVGTKGLALDPWLGASAPTSWLDIDDKLFQVQLVKNIMLHSA